MRTKCKGKSTVFFADPPRIISGGTIVGDVEAKGPLGSYFDIALEDDTWGEGTWEKAERKMFEHAVRTAVEKGGLTPMQVDILLGGDLLNQIISANFAARELEIPFLGLYGACSTMAEGLLISSLLIDSGAAKRITAVTSSHFSTAERQFRFPLSYGGQRTPTSQWTCTGSGAVILSEVSGKDAPTVAGGCIGKIADLDVSDINNMGSAMAPAAAETIRRYLTATKTSPNDYDLIVTGDLGTVGSKLVIDILARQNIDISIQHRDCGAMIFDCDAQDTHCGGSGCGCSASVLCGHFLPMLQSGEVRSMLFIATGALMSPMSVQQGESIPSIAHLVHFTRG